MVTHEHFISIKQKFKKKTFQYFFNINKTQLTLFSSFDVNVNKIIINYSKSLNRLVPPVLLFSRALSIVYEEHAVPLPSPGVLTLGRPGRQ